MSLKSLLGPEQIFNLLVVSNLESGILFARFPTVECINNSCNFLSITSWLFRKVPVEKESSLSMGGTITFLTLFPQNYIHLQQHNMSRSCDPYSTVGKRAKRMLDATVETTLFLQSLL